MAWTRVAAKLGSQLTINSLCIFNGEIFGIGEGSSWTGGVLLKWNGADSWEQVASQATGMPVGNALCVFDGNLYGTGWAGKLLRWNGVDAWDIVADTLNGSDIRSLCVYNNELYAGTGSQGTWYGSLYKWNGSNAWTRVAASYGGYEILSLCVYNNKLYGGTGVGGSSTYWGNLVEWNGSDAWVRKASYANSLTGVFSLIVHNEELYGGNGPLGSLRKWNGVDAWELVAPGLTGTDAIKGMISASDGNLYCVTDGGSGGGYEGYLEKFNGVDTLELLCERAYDQAWIFSVVELENVLYAGTGNSANLFSYALPPTAPSDGFIWIENETTHSELPLPEYPYETVIDLPFDIEQLDSGKFNIYDWGSIADKRWCECEFTLTATQMGDLVDLIKTNSRAQNYTLTLVSGCGFHPFGPDKGDNGPFTVAIEFIDRQGIGATPYLYFRVKLRLINVGAWPTYSPPAEVAEGSVTIGTVTGCRFPQDWFRPQTQYGVYLTQKESGAVSYVDRGTGGDHFQTRLPFVGNESKAAAVTAYLLSIRTGTFSLVTPEYSYAFDEDNDSSGTYTVRLTKNQLKITHEMYNRFSFDLDLSMEAVA